MFARHKTFYIRNGWLRKGLLALKQEPSIFSPANMGLAIDTLGIGKVMVSSLRYWLVAVGLTSEEREGNVVVQYPTNLAEIIMKNDEYFERKGSLWLLHYTLASNSKEATTWYWFFNDFSYKEFDQNIFLNELKKYCDKVLSKKVSESSLKKDFLCLKNTYLFSNNDSEEYSIEDTLDCPFRELKLLGDKKYSDRYSKENININELNASIAFYCILDKFKPELNQQIDFDSLMESENSIGKIFNLTKSQLYDYLDEMDRRNYISVYKRFGHNYIVILENDKGKVLDEYYSNHYLD